MELTAIEERAYEAARELLGVSCAAEKMLLVAGCSTSEVAGRVIGSASEPILAEQILHGILRAADERGAALAAQCCEHLNRALVLPVQAAGEFLKYAVNAVPRPEAGGSFAAAYYRFLSSAGGQMRPVLVSRIRAHAGLDIGQTLIGMHLREVAVPVRLSVSRLGGAVITAARTRLPFTGGSRTVYDESLL